MILVILKVLVGCILTVTKGRTITHDNFIDISRGGTLVCYILKLKILILCHLQILYFKKNESLPQTFKNLDKYGNFLYILEISSILIFKPWTFLSICKISNH